MSPRSLGLALALAAAPLSLSLVTLPSTARAAAPQVKTQAPGYYRLMLGDFEITALNDTILTLPMDKLMTNTMPAKVAAALARNHQPSPTPTSVNAFLINTGAQLILVDTGLNGLAGPQAPSHLLANLKAAGYTPDQVDAVLITHMHADHIGGLMTDGQMTFPNATLYVDAAEKGHWLNAEAEAKAPADKRGGFTTAHKLLDAYAAAGKLKTFDGVTSLFPGITAIPAHGHTPGHTVYAAESKGQKILFWGDLMHVAAVQFDTPATTVQFDSDSPAAYKERAKIFAEAAKDGYWVAAAHISFPGIGHIRPKDATDGKADPKSYVWEPAQYSLGE
ncbi:MBL fold metallo-hydrolase [Nitrospirillum viridazoti]|uniref:MBL fold metallo-hydrolase n=1 Tax=Nitrospirillum viridazoti CBAmc TaxID=1441467 RepID=A0A248JPU7_9PROT|nr:MBL fold metallo-hydrolase [Nitrospirillum amazonense]ASG20727.1 MBL fold metallo-hydrolase [Nitrospirillum amazonense CBAmc]TWB37947.1 glyoxylase-like metal-dependent hydrolase (beta-lactamase superfamily II) [Nitrospirillum amazonense]